MFNAQAMLSILGKRYQLPKNMQSPNDIIQHLLNSGQVTQDQVNMAMNRMNQIRNNPQMIEQMQSNPMFKNILR